jgi:predicted metal-dependent enzyme (double-stranded beta helix superfamily)
MNFLITHKIEELENSRRLVEELETVVNELTDESKNLKDMQEAIGQKVTGIEEVKTNLENLNSCTQANFDVHNKLLKDLDKAFNEFKASTQLSARSTAR